MPSLMGNGAKSNLLMIMQLFLARERHGHSGISKMFVFRAQVLHPLLLVQI
jgi:hypothetical protein